MTAGGHSHRAVIAYLNDLHWNFLVYPRIVTALRRARASHPHLLYFDIGDTLSDVYEGRPLIALMNLSGVDGWVLGNHDFDYGLPYLRKRIADARFPAIVANLRFDRITPLCVRPFVERQVHGIRMAFFGLTTPNHGPDKGPPPGILIEDPVRVARGVVRELRGRSDLLVCLSHLGFEADCQLATRVRGIDAIIGGHSHTLLPSPALVGKTLICQAGGEGHYLGMLHVLGSPGRLTFKGELVALDEHLAPDPEALGVLSRWMSGRQGHAPDVLGEALTSFVDEKYGRETALGNLVCDTIREETGAQVSFYNATGVNNVIAPGPITIHDLAIAFHFDNTIWVLHMKGRQILQVLERALESSLDDNYYFLHTSGLRVYYDSKSPAGRRVRSVRAEGRSLDLDRTYRVAITEFLAHGGHEQGRQFSVFREQAQERTPFTTRGLMRSLVLRRRRIAGAVEGRLVDEARRGPPASARSASRHARPTRRRRARQAAIEIGPRAATPRPRTGRTASG